MVFTDTHCHLYSEEFNEDRTTVIERAFSEGVQRIFLPNIDMDSVEPMLSLTRQYPGKCYAAMGLHPCSVKPGYEAVLDNMYKLLTQQPFVAIGETGIDLYWDTTYKKEQVHAFEIQLAWAKQLKLPIIIHVRNSFAETLEMVDRLNDESLTGIFHCFSGTLEQAEDIISYGGFKLGIGGVLTFKNSGLDKVVEKLDIKHLVLETDSPYLAPAPLRGKRNEPAYTVKVAEKLAQLHGLTMEEVAEITTNNSKEIFNC